MKKKKKSTGKARAMKYDTPYLVYSLEIVPTVIHQGGSERS